MKLGPIRRSVRIDPCRSCGGSGVETAPARPDLTTDRRISDDFIKIGYLVARDLKLSEVDPEMLVSPEAGLRLLLIEGFITPADTTYYTHEVVLRNGEVGCFLTPDGPIRVLCPITKSEGEK